MTTTPEPVYVGWDIDSWVAITRDRTVLGRSTRRRDVERISRAYAKAQRELGVTSALGAGVDERVRELLYRLKVSAF